MDEPLYLVCRDCNKALAWSANFNNVAPYLFGLDHEGHRLIAVREGSRHLKHCQIYFTYQPQQK